MDESLMVVMEEALRPFARAYIGLPAEVQLQLAGEVPVRLTYLRDAYLALARLRRVRSNRPPPP